MSNRISIAAPLIISALMMSSGPGWSRNETRAQAMGGKTDLTSRLTRYFSERMKEGKLTDGYMYLDNGVIRIGVDLTVGGTVCYLSTSGTTYNLVNIYDLGRYIQQSYYAGDPIDRRSEGQNPAFSPWNWNPIQAGSIGHVPSKILHSTVSNGELYVKCIPMLWDMPNEPAECVLEEWITLSGRGAHIRNMITITRNNDRWTNVRNRDQECPAVYTIGDLQHLYTYQGAHPWTSDKNLDEIPHNPIGYDPSKTPVQENGFPWCSFTPTENWAAWVNDEGWGVGVYNTNGDEGRWLGGFISQGKGDSLKEPSGYIAPLKSAALGSNTVWGYDYWLIVGTIAEIRNFVYRKNSSK